MVPNSVMDIRYAAGLFDGEGYIRISRQQLKQFKTHVRYQLFVGMAMTDPRALVQFGKEFGGSLCWGSPRKNPIHKPLHFWTVSSLNARLFLERVRPYLIVKAEQADLAIEFQNGKESKPYWGKVTSEEYARRERIRKEILRLKHVLYDPADFGMVANSVNSQNGQYRAKQEPSAPGVCNEQVPPSTEKMCSDLHGNMQSEAEMTSPFPIIYADWMPEGKWALINWSERKE